MKKDLDVPGQVGNVVGVQSRLRDHFKATEVDISTDSDGVTVRLRFNGFGDIQTAHERIGEVCERLYGLPEAPDVHSGVNTAGVSDKDDRPSGWVNATFRKTPQRIVEIDGEAEA